MPLLGILLVAISLAALLPGAAAADFTVSPTVIDVRGERGQAVTGVFTVRMRREAGRRFTIEIQDALQRPDGSFALQAPTRSSFSASTWVSVSPPRFPGRRDRTQPVEFRVLVPERAEPGDHVTSLTVSRIPSDRPTAVPIQAISVRLTVQVAGRRRPGAEIAALDAPTVSDGKPVSVSALVRNTGNVRLDFGRAAEGGLALLRGTEPEASLRFANAVYPGQQRLFELSWDGAPLVARLDATAWVDAGDETVRESTLVMIVPWRQVGATVLIALAVAVLLIGRARRRLRPG